MGEIFDRYYFDASRLYENIRELLGTLKVHIVGHYAIVRVGGFIGIY